MAKVTVNAKPDLEGALDIDGLLPATKNFPYWTFYYPVKEGMKRVTFVRMEDIETLTMEEEVQPEDVASESALKVVPFPKGGAA